VEGRMRTRMGRRNRGKKEEWSKEGKRESVD
jgi:hypothetical protein